MIILKVFGGKGIESYCNFRCDKAYSEVDFVVIAAPTNYDPLKNYLILLMWRK